MGPSRRFRLERRARIDLGAKKDTEKGDESPHPAELRLDPIPPGAGGTRPHYGVSHSGDRLPGGILTEKVSTGHIFALFRFP